jgi:UDP-3-O-[3-hydroxymyristoyl] glucosamine N-acyltransferase
MQKSLKQLAEETKSTLVGDPAHLITGVSDLAHAKPSDASFLSNPLYRPQLKTTKAGVICATAPLLEGKNYLLSDNPTATFQELIRLFIPPTPSGFEGIHPTAVIHASAKIGQNVTIGPYSSIDANAHVGDSTHIGPHVSIGPSVQIGTHCLIHPHVTIREGCTIGSRVILQPGCVIGCCGYGYTTNVRGEHEKQEQLGIVEIEDDVEIGANTTIDRARFGKTLIGRGTKIDNLVQIGHNTQLGAHNLIVAQTGISGSVKTGRYVVMGGQTGTVGHIEIADQALFAARSGIKKSIKSKGKYGGNPAIPLEEHQREQVLLRRLIKKET